ERDRLDRFLLYIEFEMVLQVLSDAGPVGDDLDAVLGKMLCRPDAGKHQELRRIDGGGGDDDFTPRFNDLNLSASFDLDAGRALILDDHTPRETIDEIHIPALQGGAQIGIGGGPAAAHMDRLLHGAEAFLLGAVIVVRDLEACLPARIGESGVERVEPLAALDMQRTVRAAPAGLAAMGGLHALEIGKHV